MTEIQLLDMNIGQVGSDFDSIKDSIVDKGVEVAEGTPTSQYAAKVGEVYEAGKRAQYNEFWDGIFSGRNWQCKFYGSSWNDNTFYPNQDIKPSGYANNLFALCEITDLVARLQECGVTLDTSNIDVRSDYMFNYATKITRVPFLDLRKVGFSTSFTGGVLNSMFNNCTSLVTIDGIQLHDDGSQRLGMEIFTNCKTLENITFYGVIGGADNINFRWSTKLSKTSITSIINALSSTTSGLTVTLSKTAVDNAFTGGSTGEEWLNLIATKNNWTISLV